jgi:hypothetical protein
MEAGDETTRELDEEVADERRAQGSTVAALNAFSAPDVAPELRSKLRYTDPDDAIQRLASAVEQGTLRVPRLLVLDSLVKLASRRGDQLRTREAALDKLLEALVRQARGREAEVGAEAEVGTAVLTVRGALESVASLSDVASPPDPWKVFVLQAGDALGLSQAEIDKPRCNDAGIVKKGNLKARALTVEFHTDASPGDLRHFCDPRRWHECSAYQKEMTKWSGAGAKPDEDRPPDGWRRDLFETVQLAPGFELQTPLRFTHTIQDPNDPSWVHLDYALIGETEDIEVDEGALDVRRVTTGKHQGRTRVSAIKAIRFKDDLLDDWTSIACDTFWMDLVIKAAVGCPGPGATIDSKGGTPTMAKSKEARLEQTIDEAAAAAKESIETYRQLAKKGAGQLAGDSPADTEKWVELTAKTWAQVARDTARAWMTFNAVLQGFAESGEGKAKQSDPGEGDNDD